MKYFFIFCILFSVVASFSQNAVPPGSWPWLSREEASESDFADETPETLRLMRNEIFARHGYIFKSADLAEHFKKQSWYKPQFANVDAKLTAVEKKNIALIVRMEKKLADAALNSPLARKIKKLPFLRLPLSKETLRKAVMLAEEDSDPQGEAPPPQFGRERALYGLLPDTSKIYAVVWLAPGPMSIAATYVITVTTLDKSFKMIDSAPIDIYTRFDEFGSDGSCGTSDEKDSMTLNADWSYYAEHSGRVTCYDLEEGEKRKQISSNRYEAIVSGHINRDGTITKEQVDRQ